MIYENIVGYKKFKDDIIKKKQDFIITSTNYTKKVKIDGVSIIFNTTGKRDNKILKMINSVRRDADIFLLENNKITNSYINFFKLIGDPRKQSISKVDVHAAYWMDALYRGIISKKSDNLLHKLYKDTDNMKKARLKALGSLATRKRIETYIKGKLAPEQYIEGKLYRNPAYKVEKTREIYMDICRDIDRLMIEASQAVPKTFYYYWDCIFVNSDFEWEAIEYFKNSGYSSHTDITELEFIKIGDGGYLISKQDDKSYMVRKDDIFKLMV